MKRTADDARRLRRRGLPGAAVLLLAGCGLAPAPSPGPSGLPEARQLVVVTTPGWDSTAGQLQRFARAGAGAPWQAEGRAVPVVIGRTGLAWGVGFDAYAEADSPTAGPRKREGDGRSPAGAFPLVSAFGFAPADSARAVRVPYLQLTPATECVDDTASAHYNAVVERDRVASVDWRSAERMRRIGQYRLGVVVGYNTGPAVKGRGSCIFLHDWAGPGTTTSGCTALAAAELTRLAEWLDPRARPAVVQLPGDVYRRLREAWGLPALER